MRAAAFTLFLALVAGCVAPTQEPLASTSTPPASNSSTDVPGTPAPPGEVMFLLVHDSYWINETGPGDEGYQTASFPHCGQGSYTLDPDSVRIVHYGEEQGPAAKSAIMRDYDNRTPVPFPMFGSPSSVAVSSSEHSVAVLDVNSPFNESRKLATVVLNGDSIRVNGVLLHDGDSTEVRSIYRESHDGKEYEISQVLDFFHRGPAPLEEDFHEQPCI